MHRIGQTRDVTVTRLLVDGTVEQAVMHMLKVGVDGDVDVVKGDKCSGSTARRGGPSESRG